MFNPKQLEEMAQKLYSALPSSLQNLESEVQQKFKEILNASFAKLDLVTREEFDVQTKVLARTREKVESLETEIHKILKEKQSDME